MYYLIMENIRTTAVQYLKSISEDERKNLKTMLNNGIKCCIGYAKRNKINPDVFNQELLSIFKGN